MLILDYMCHIKVQITIIILLFRFKLLIWEQQNYVYVILTFFLSESETIESEEKRKIDAEMQTKAKSVVKEVILVAGLICVAVSLSFSSHDTGGFYIYSNIKGLFIDSFGDMVSWTHFHLKLIIFVWCFVNVNSMQYSC